MAPSTEHRPDTYVNTKEQIARFASLRSSITLANKTNICTFIHTGRNLNLYFSVSSYDSLPPASRTRIGDDGPFTATLPTLCSNRDESLGYLFLYLIGQWLLFLVFDKSGWEWKRTMPCPLQRGHFFALEPGADPEPWQVPQGSLPM